MTAEHAATMADHVAQFLRTALRIDGEVSTAIILGTGWGDALRLVNARSVPMADLPWFGHLGSLSGHHRVVEVGELDGEQVILLRGRVHLNEHPTDPSFPQMVRLQTEMLCKLGIRNLIVTAGVGGLGPTVHVGDIVIVDGFAVRHAPPMPLFAGEFEEADVVLDEKLIRTAMKADSGTFARQIGGHVMVRGPNFESRKYDKPALRGYGVKVVGMSMLPEACVAMLYRKQVRVLAACYVTNNDTEEHSHQMNVDRATSTGDRLGEYLADVVERITRGIYDT